MRIKLSSFLLIFLFVLSPLALAQDAVPAPDADELALPSVNLMGCRGACANFVPAKGLNIEPPKFPHEEYNYTRVMSEGSVRLLYTIGPDGTVHDIFVISLVGPRSFADKSIEAVRVWKFQPATSDGKPVAQSAFIPLSYRRSPIDRRIVQTPLEAVQALRDYPALLQQGKPEEARAELENVLKNVHLTFYDRANILAPLADMAFKRGDYLEARRLATIATLSGAQRGTWLVLIKADLMLGNIPDAEDAFRMLQKRVGTFAADFALPKLMETAQAKADAAPVLAFQAQIPPPEDGDVYTFYPYRRSFTFQNVQGGSLQKFVMACTQATMESQITATAQWRIPDRWSGCSVHVLGTPGTKFLVEEPKD